MLILVVFIIFICCISISASSGGIYYFRKDLNKKGLLPDSLAGEDEAPPSQEQVNSALDTARSISTPNPSASSSTAGGAPVLDASNDEEFNDIKESGKIIGNVLVKNKICIKDWCIFKVDDNTITIRQKNSTGGDNSGSFNLTSDGNMYIVNGSKKGWASEGLRDAKNGINEFKDRTIKFGDTHYIKSIGKGQYIMRWQDGTIAFSGNKADWERFALERSGTGDGWPW